MHRGKSKQTQGKKKNLLPEIHRLPHNFLHIHPAQNVGQDDPHLVPGEVDADAGVFAGGEGVVGVGAALRGNSFVSIDRLINQWSVVCRLCWTWHG
jgi:hypothetical protein